jgi:hypothetical protein
MTERTKNLRKLEKLTCEHHTETEACSAYEGEENLGDPGVDGRIIIRWICRMWDVGVWTGSSWLRIGTGGGHL